jgi:hypothetical protein
MEGGYYKMDLTDKLSVLALNTLMFNSNLKDYNYDPNADK